ncbi:MAG: metallophosphoesterase [Acidobacteriota bacterium]
MSRIHVLSDLHVDFAENRHCLNRLSSSDFRNDILLLAGDISDDLEQVRSTLGALRDRFAQVFFVPGNHELWVRRKECANSVEKFRKVLEVCDSLGVRTRPQRAGQERDGHRPWIVPLFSWYMQPEEGSDSLFVAKSGEDPSLSMWADNYYTRWSSLDKNGTVADYFLEMNESRIERDYEPPVITMSHFLPRRELMFSSPKERQAIGAVRDRHPSFNFSRVAGSKGLDRQIRQVGATLHIYGHQHRNRWRKIDRVAYLSHCLGTPGERARGELPEAGPSAARPFAWGPMYRDGCGDGQQ